MGRERSGWGCSSWLTLGNGGSEREIDEGAVVLVLEQDRG
jgi:hypothetical protein